MRHKHRPSSRDMAERRRLQREILEISAREQQRIGQDLHDDLCQQLTAITMLSKVLERKLAVQSLPEVIDAREIHQLVAKAIVQTRLLAKGLLPIDFEADGLVSALDDLASNTAKLSHRSCLLESGKDVLIRNGAVAIQLYRIAQEAVANAVRHAGAKEIVISLFENSGKLTLSVLDNGVGIGKRSGSRKGLGLSIMNSRAETINATLQIKRRERGGTIVSCSLATPTEPTARHSSRQISIKGHHD